MTERENKEYRMRVSREEKEKGVKRRDEKEKKNETRESRDKTKCDKREKVRREDENLHLLYSFFS